MRSWKVGNTTIYQIVEQVLPKGLPGLIPEATPEALLAIEWLYPEFITKEGEPSLSLHALVIDTPTKRILVDTCIGNSKSLPIVPEWDQMQTDFLRKLESAGFSRESIDAVVCTHLHLDHVGWNTMLVAGRWVPTFPKARYLFGRTEYEHLLAEISGSETPVDWRACIKAVQEESIGPVIAAGLVDFVETHHQICAEVRLVPTLGHTPGHVSVEVTSGGNRALITGDSVHHPSQIAHPEWTTIADANGDQAAQTRRDMFAEALTSQVLMIGTHWTGVGAGRISRDGDKLRLQF